MTDQPGSSPPDDPFDPFGEPPAPTGQPGPAHPASDSEHRAEPDFDPELTRPVAPTFSAPESRPSPVPDEELDPERTTAIAPPAPVSTPPPVFVSGHVPHVPPVASGPAGQHTPPAAPIPSYAPPPMFTAQYAPQQQTKDRRPLVFGIIAACAALVVVLVVVVVAIADGGGPLSASGGADTPQAAAKGYLEALARGDANAALGFGDNKPGSADLLTDDVLAKQIKAAPITDIQILDDESPVGDYARVHVSAKFGSDVSDTELTVRKTDGQWKLPDAAVKLDFGDMQRTNKALRALTVFGKPTTNPVYVFPGYVDYGTSNPNLLYEAKKPMLDQLTMFTQFASVAVQLSGDADNAINAAVADDLAKCTASNKLAPPGCPLRVEPTNLVDGTAQWGAMSDLNQLKKTFNPYTMTVAINGIVNTMFTAQTRSGTPTTGNLTGIISATADLSNDPPTITYR